MIDILQISIGYKLGTSETCRQKTARFCGKKNENRLGYYSRKYPYSSPRFININIILSY